MLLKMKVFLFLSAIVSLAFVNVNGQCLPSVTTASGLKAPSTICSGDLIFEDNFNDFDLQTWEHEMTLGGGGNWEFQWYVNSNQNSFVENGKLYIKPTLTSDMFGEDFLTSGTVTIPENVCTNAEFYGCQRSGSPENIINPIRSARVRTLQSFNFKYGKLEVRAKMPAGDWIWPAIWLLPKTFAYGGWPRSGEIDLTEARGNRKLFGDKGINVGVEQAGSTLHFGPTPYLNGYPMTNFVRNREPGYDQDFHTYRLEWTPDTMEFILDGVTLGLINSTADGGFWKRGEFDKRAPGMENIWSSLNAPFDQEFHLIMNNAVGGVNYFSDNFVNRDHPKPWSNNSPRASADFWEARADWLPTWNLQNSTDADLQVDYVRVWAL